MHVRRVASPPSLWPASAPCADADYSDTFEASVAAAEEQPAEAWMRTALEGAPLLVRCFVKFGWRFVLGFRPSRSANILGWPIVESTDERILLEQKSRLVAAALLLRTGPAGVTWATRVRYEAKGASIVWGVVGVVHRRVVPYIISRAALAHA